MALHIQAAYEGLRNLLSGQDSTGGSASESCRKGGKNFLTELSELQLKNCKNYSLRAVKSTVQELSKLQPNNTNKNNTEMNNTDYEPIREDKQAAEIEERAIYKDIVKDNIRYEELIRGHPLEREIIEQTVELMIDIMCSKESYIRIGKDEKPQQVVKSMFCKLKYEHILYVLECLNDNRLPH